MSFKGRARNVLYEDAGRTRFLGRWDYSISLIEKLLEEGLVDQTRWAERVLEWWKCSHLAQLGWIHKVLSDFTVGIICRIRWMAKDLIDITIERLSELENAEGREEEEDLMFDAKEACRDLLRSIWQLDPDAFLQPRLWLDAGRIEALRKILLNTREYHPDFEERSRCWVQLEARVDSLLYPLHACDTDISCKENGFGDSDLSLSPITAMETIYDDVDKSKIGYFLTLLDSVAPLDSLQAIFARFFGLPSLPTAQDYQTPPFVVAPTPPSIPSATPALPSHKKIVLLIEWATTKVRYGPHRKYLAAQLLAIFLKSDTTAISKEGGESQHEMKSELPEVILQNGLLEFIDNLSNTSPLSLERYESVLDLYSELCGNHLFDVGRFLQSMISRGVRTASMHDSGESIHVRLLRELPLQDQSAPVEYQLRRLLPKRHDTAGELTGRARQEMVEITLRLSSFDGLESEMKAPFIATQNLNNGQTVDGDTIRAKAKDVMPLSERRRVYREWLLPLLLKKLSSMRKT